VLFRSYRPGAAGKSGRKVGVLVLQYALWAGHICMHVSPLHAAMCYSCSGDGLRHRSVHNIFFPPAEVEIAKRPDGSDWVLGSGGFGKVGQHCSATVRLTCRVSCTYYRCHAAKFAGSHQASRGPVGMPAAHASAAAAPRLRLAIHFFDRLSLLQVFKALRHGVQPVAVKIIPVRCTQIECWSALHSRLNRLHHST